MLKSFIKNFLIIISIIWIIILLVFFWGAKIEPRLLTVNKKAIFIPDENKQLNGLKIAVLSDLHLGSLNIDKKKLEKIIKKTNLEKPDLIFITGDIDARTTAYAYKDKKHIVEQLKKLSPAIGTYAILGNHDFKPENTVKPIYQQSKIPLLVDEYIEIKSKDRNFYIAGLNDKWGHNSEKEISNLISKIPKGKAVILLAHNPDVFPKVPNRVNLTISGHTHGGQIYLPFFGGLFIPSEYNQRFVKGYIVENNKRFYVSSGIGNAAPFRLGNIPEINILTLHSQNSKNKIINTKPKTGIDNIMYLGNKIKKSKWYFLLE